MWRNRMTKKPEKTLDSQLSFEFPEGSELHINVKDCTSIYMCGVQNFQNYIPRSLGVSKIIDLHDHKSLINKRKEYIDLVLKETKSF